MWLFTLCDPEVQISHIFSLLLAGDFRGLFNWSLKAAPLLTNPGCSLGLVLPQTRF